MVSTFRFLTGVTLVGAFCFAQPAVPPHPPVPPVPPAVEMRGLLTMSGRSYLGVNVKEIDSKRSKELGLSDEHGVEITQIEENSPASKGGLKLGDVVLDYNGQRIEGTEQFVRMVRETPVGRPVKLNVNRQGAVQTLTATIAPRKSGGVNDVARTQEAMRLAERARAKAMEGVERAREQMEQFQFDTPRAYMGWSSVPLGVDAEALTDQLAGFFGVKEGVLVRSVRKESAAAKAGIKAGDVILKVEGSKVATPREISSQLRSAREKKTIQLQLMRERKEMSFDVTLPEARPASVAPRSRVVINGNQKTDPDDIQF